MNKESPNTCGCSGGSGQQTGCASEKPSTEITVFHVSNMDCRNEEALVRRTLEGTRQMQPVLRTWPCEGLSLAWCSRCHRQPS